MADSRGLSKSDIKQMASPQHELDRLRAALKQIEQMPFMMTNDSESLRYTIKTIQRIARDAVCDMED